MVQTVNLFELHIGLIPKERTSVVKLTTLSCKDAVIATVKPQSVRKGIFTAKFLQIFLRFVMTFM